MAEAVLRVFLLRDVPSLAPETAFASEILPEISITSATTSVTAGVLPSFSVSTATEHVTIDTYYCNWGRRDSSDQNWDGWGGSTPIAYNDGDTHYGLGVKVKVDSGYAIDSTTRVIFNGADVTSSGYTEVTSYSWGGYIDIDLGLATGENPVTHTVRFETNGGGTIWNQTILDGETAGKPSNPTKNAYTFEGWYTESTFQNAFDFSTPVTSDLTLYAKWTPKTVLSEVRITSAITSVSEGELPTAAASTTTAHITITQVGWARKDADTTNWSGWGYNTPTAVNDGRTHYALCLAVYLQAGSTFDDNTKIYYNGVDVTSSGYTDIQAISEWGGYVHIDLGQASGTRSYIVDFNMNGCPNWGPSSQTILTGGTVTQPEDPSWDFYDFAGWYTDKACTDGNEYDFSAPVTSELTLYAKWTTCTVKLYARDGGGVSYYGMSYAVVSESHGSKGSTFTAYAQPLDGFHFKEWQYESGPVASTEAVYTFTLEKELMSLYAVFESDSIRGSVTIPQGVYYVIGSTITADVSGITDLIAGGVFRYQWQISSDQETWTDIAGAAEQTLTAPAVDADRYVRVKVTADGFSGEVYSIAVQVHAQYPITVTDGKAYYGAWKLAKQVGAGTKITLKANAAPDGMSFKKWVVTGATLDDETAETAHFTMPANAVTAKAVYVSDDLVVRFVTQLYRTCFDREPDEEGLNYWVTNLKEDKVNAKTFVFSIFFSEEYADFHLCNECFVTDLYGACMNREPDTGGYNYWTTVLNARDDTRFNAVNNFLDSDEFRAFCAGYGIDPGGRMSDSSKNYAVTSGVCKRCKLCVGEHSFGDYVVVNIRERTTRLSGSRKRSVKT